MAAVGGFFLVVAGLALWFGGDEPVAEPEQPVKDAYPSQVLDLTNWKITLPVDADGDGRADEIRQPCLAVACYDPKRKMYDNPIFKKPFSDGWFHINKQRNGVVFRAPVRAPSTVNSENARSELRELAPANDKGEEVEARWSNKGPAVHTMDVEQAIISTPRNYPSVVCAQIHNDDDDVILIKLRGTRLFANADRGNFDETLDSHYRLGTRFSLRIQATQGVIRVTYNGKKTVTYKKASDTMYFKTGVYNQSNLEKNPDEDPNSYGEVVIYKLQVTHDGAPAAPADESSSDSDSDSSDSDSSDDKRH
ncbi:MAG TPA: polysaccharide lyase family 7 protein [Aeromicrobium sp.]|nr:polysaccharide lyase family 7 protein [Aeromicrobium sp.]